ncbi:MAG: flagellar biosynthetic protein FliR [Lachnospiraceae bacterium]|nr:flagellar biosynthetic protein FliR [Lachnospiraceae bacterium]MBR5760499.1 flagellar biosynthetic protein FliR [Lachnospiraceae bacterium]MBR5993965.1 flagellar biosynthetic protein FliR [Lachnospiraceae bacterium]
MFNFTFSLRDLEFFLLIVVRITCFIHTAPFFGMTNTPNRVKIGLGVLISALVYQTLTPVHPEYSTVLMYALYVLKEAVTGIIIGYSAAICVAILNFAGHLVDMEIGLSMVSLFDPVSRDSVTISGTYYQYTVLLMLMISGMYQYVLAAIIETFNLIPVSGAVFNSDRILNAMLTFLRDYLALGFRLCLPVFAAMLLLNAILGILAKVSPQLNMFAVGIQLKILLGLGVLFLTVGMMPGASTAILSEMKKMITLFAEAIT